MQNAIFRLPQGVKGGFIKTRLRKTTVIIIKDYRLESKTLVKSELRKFDFLIFNQNICCGYSKEPSQ